MKRLISAVVLALCLVGGGMAMAQEPPKQDDGWQQVDGSMMAKGETIPAARLVGLAYGFIFAAVVVWVASVAQRSRRLEDEVDAFKRKLESRG